MKYWLGKLFLFVVRWKVAGAPPACPKFIVIAAPHTSNWDFFLGLATSFCYRLKIRWFGKHTIFVWPVGLLLKKLGGIPINRALKHNTVEQTTRAFEQSTHCVVVLAPEGTRKRVEYWKSGFYHIALRAEVPLALGFIDYSKREVGIGPTLDLTGNFKNDMNFVRNFYKKIKPKYPSLFGPVRIKEEDREPS